MACRKDMIRFKFGGVTVRNNYNGMFMPAFVNIMNTITDSRCLAGFFMDPLETDTATASAFAGGECCGANQLPRSECESIRGGVEECIGNFVEIYVAFRSLLKLQLQMKVGAEVRSLARGRRHFILGLHSSLAP